MAYSLVARRRALGGRVVSGLLCGLPTALGLVVAACVAGEDAASSSEAAVGTEPAVRPPVLGWGTWNRFRCEYDEAKLLASADALVASGMRDAGYDTFILDDCWQDGARDESGELRGDPARFPRGMKAFGDDLHARGLKFGIYSAVGNVTCELRPGSWEHEEIDARTFASWGVDFLKLDWCWHAGALEAFGQLEAKAAYEKMAAALAATGRPIVFSIASMGTREAVMVMREKWIGEWAPAISDMWRVSGDITNDWTGVTHNLARANDWAASARPGRYNDPDNLQVGNGVLTLEESRTHLSMWAIAGAPLIAGNDLREMADETRALLTNRDVIAIDQDARLVQGTKVYEASGLEVWSKPLAPRGGKERRAVAFYNPTNRERSASVGWDVVGLAPARAHVRDVWTGAESESDGFRATVPPHGVTLLLVDGAPAPAPRGEPFVSDLVFTYAANYWGVVERDRSVGDRAPGDGRPLSVGGQRFEKGIGVHAPSEVRVRLGKACSSLHAEIGLDDEGLWDGGATFEVWGDDARLYASDLRHKGPALPIDVDVAGREELRLVVRGGGALDFDHADWAGARLRCAP